MSGESQNITRPSTQPSYPWMSQPLIDEPFAPIQAPEPNTYCAVRNAQRLARLQSLERQLPAGVDHFEPRIRQRSQDLEGPFAMPEHNGAYRPELVAVGSQFDLHRVQLATPPQLEADLRNFKPSIIQFSDTPSMCRYCHAPKGFQCLAGECTSGRSR